MYARVWKFKILSGKVEEFAAAINSFLPTVRRQAGFRGVLALRGGPGEKLEVIAFSMWDSLEALRNSETHAYQEALLRLLACCERHPSMREEEVLVSEFASQDLSDTTVGF